MTKTKTSERRRLYWWEEQQLRRAGCRFAPGSEVLVSPQTDLECISGVEFRGRVSIGALSQEQGMLANARLEDVVIGDNVSIRNVGGHIRGCEIGDRASVENIARIEFEPEAMCGLMIPVNVLDETGSRPVHIYPGLTSQTAWMAAHFPRWEEETMRPWLDDRFGPDSPRHVIGSDCEIRDCGTLRNVIVGNNVRIVGARRLVNGMIVNNVRHSHAFAYVGPGVDAENFIIEDGHVDAGSLLRNCYVGQGVIVDKGFTAHDSLLFANTSLENGEACALFAGPYTVSMHKSSLLIGCEVSFMNAGSATNQSNHMYKLGPVHWGIMQRGAKTASSSYVMWGAKIGAFSLLMGVHKNHPDSSAFPFSYLFGDEKGATTVVPAMMLRSCGLMRDEKKWPMRDRRIKARMPMHDRINFTVLNPSTVDAMVKARHLIDTLLEKGVDDDLFIRYKGMKFRASSLDRAKKYYEMAIGHYLHNRLGDNDFPEPTGFPAAEWLDVGGQIVTRDDLRRAASADSLEEAEGVFTEAFKSFGEREMRWIGDYFGDEWRRARQWLPKLSEDYQKLVEDDRLSYRRDLDEEIAMLSEKL